MRARHVEEAGAIAEQVRRAIIRRNMMQLRRVNTRQCAKEVSAKVRQFTKGQGKDSSQTNPGLTAHALNSHYAAVSSDSRYRVPPAKHTVSLPCQHVTEMEVFRMLDCLKPTTTGLIRFQHGS